MTQQDDTTNVSQYEINKRASKARAALFEQWFNEIPRDGLQLDFFLNKLAWAERCVAEFPRYDGESTQQIVVEYQTCLRVIDYCKSDLCDYVVRQRHWLAYNEACHAWNEGTLTLDNALEQAKRLMETEWLRVEVKR